MQGGQLRASVAFPALALFNMLREPIYELPTAFTCYINAFVSAKRLQEFLQVRFMLMVFLRSEADCTSSLCLRLMLLKYCFVELLIADQVCHHFDGSFAGRSERGPAVKAASRRHAAACAAAAGGRRAVHRARRRKLSMEGRLRGRPAGAARRHPSGTSRRPPQSVVWPASLGPDSCRYTLPCPGIGCCVRRMLCLQP